MTSHVEQQIAARIAAARIRVAAAKERRTSLAEARKRGLAHRHARKLRNLAAAEQRAQQQTLDDGQDDEPVSAIADADHRASGRTTDGSAADNPSAANDTTEGAAP